MCAHVKSIGRYERYIYIYIYIYETVEAKTLKKIQSHSIPQLREPDEHCPVSLVFY